MATVRRFATARKRTLDAVKLAHAIAPFKRAADLCDLAYFDRAALCTRQQQNVAKLKSDARSLVGIIGSDKAKIQTYCQIEDLTEKLDRAVQEKDSQKAKALVKRIAELNKKMGPQFAALADIEKHVDLNSRDGQEIASVVASLGESCGEK